MMTEQGWGEEEREKENEIKGGERDTKRGGRERLLSEHKVDICHLLIPYYLYFRYTAILELYANQCSCVHKHSGLSIWPQFIFRGFEITVFKLTRTQDEIKLLLLELCGQITHI